ncbi:WcaI family glycosyltransferase [Panacibacter sp. DH6]|uniref:WcaI family glycosyltransferase n=1 Tax=Panacibacter microcysteis TaxID=2793269 RepID=A0A931GVQ6_9BACT|nr:WcaI family glycosyltransferase [Panacibacter microcysteis]MBG9375343.1 WcaI family glycosyltransferase [Panacibacter microcysteis]
MAHRILLIGGNFSPEPTGIGKYNGEMMQWLANNGNECAVVTTYPYYPQWRLREPYKSHNWYKKENVSVKGSGTLTVYRCPHYIPANPTGKTRVLHDLSFAIAAFFKVFALLFSRKYDVVINVSPPLIPGLIAIMYKKLRGAKFVYHIQDLQVDAANDLEMIKSKRLINVLFGIERLILKQADYVSSISPGMIKKIKSKVNKDIVFFPNWSDTSFFYPINDKVSLKADFGFQPSDIIALYSGAIGEKQGLEAILHAASKLQNVSGLKFVICGSGPYREKLEGTAKAMQLHNLFFMPLQPLEMFNRFLNMADIHLVIQKVNAGDLVMPSKLTNILAVGGLALVTANPGTSLYELVNDHQMGILADAENQDALEKGILQAMGESAGVYRDNARRFAEANLAIDMVMQRYSKQLLAPAK